MFEVFHADGDFRKRLETDGEEAYTKQPACGFPVSFQLTSHSRANAKADVHSSKERSTSLNLFPDMLGAMSDSTTSTRAAPRSCPSWYCVSGDKKSPRMVVTPGIGAMGSKSTAITRCCAGDGPDMNPLVGSGAVDGFGSDRREATCDHPPGAPPRSTTTFAPSRNPNLWFISTSLNADRARKLPSDMFLCLTKGSRACRLSHSLDDLDFGRAPSLV